MAYSDAEFWDAESNDPICERAPPDSGVTIQNIAGRRQTGDYGFDFDYTPDPAVAEGAWVRGTLAVGAAAGILVVSGAWGLSAAPSAAIAIMRGGATTQGLIEVGTDRKVRLYDKNGNQYGDPSTTLIPTSGIQEMHVVYDGLTLSTVYIKVYFGGTEEQAFDTGVAWANFFATSDELVFGEKVVAGCHVYGDDLCYRKSITSGDAPHLADYPRLKGVGQMVTPPDANGNYSGWSPQGDTNVYDCVDDPGDHDGDTTKGDTFDKGDKHTLTFSASNPLPVGVTVDLLQLRGVGKFTSDKVGAHFMVRLGGSDELGTAANVTPFSVYTGGVWRTVPRPGGGSWARTDADPGDVEFGWESEDVGGIDTGAAVTKQPGPTWVYHTANLASGTTPASAAGAKRSFGVIIG